MAERKRAQAKAAAPKELEAPEGIIFIPHRLFQIILASASPSDDGKQVNQALCTNSSDCTGTVNSISCVNSGKCE